MRKTTYAAKTAVPVNRSQEEIRKVLTKYGAEGFVFGENRDGAMVAFEIDGRRIKFNIPMPLRPPASAPQVRMKEWEQKCKSRWRSMALGIKAKLECVAVGITTIEQEFMSHIVLPNGTTVGAFMLPQIEKSYQLGIMPPLLGAPESQ
ncbi:hypothetical protein Bb109J_c1975 [Bdellovibrio bacteriovorus]|uniref:hypothetical protein n=1 Tax=Bdellovibrio bacteriovorus TaxID=959 RepID=UPI00045BF972|nr:hypothetical protein [Bdellovibrio bacteriovorus]AHZ84665.1 hypothetical protein EP01_06905 [Bdellovibrio bacteriovorus]BEV68555.1 hypothetical protein Bb109J_c1975 [Bdellovibrio bacteriovorus]